MTYRLQDVLANRQVTSDLIREEGRPIQLFRPPEAASDGAGGRLVATGESTPQTIVKRFFSLVEKEPVDENTPQGESLPENFVLIGMYNDDIREEDEFFIDNLRYHIERVHVDRTYQVKAEGACYHDGS